MSALNKYTASQSYHITSLLVNPMGRLGLFGTLNLLQETAWKHADNLGFGMKAMEKHNLYWVVTRQILAMREWPRYGENVNISTWLRPPEGAFVAREFLITGDEGREIGSSATSWLAIDRTSKKILPAGKLFDWNEIATEASTGLVPEKIPAEGAFEKLAKFRVRNSDLDVNQHVNNTKYSQWILDSIPYENHKNVLLKSYSVNFLAETHLGDEVRIERNLSCPVLDEAASGETIYRGMRVSDDRVLFTAILSWEKKL